MAVARRRQAFPRLSARRPALLLLTAAALLLAGCGSSPETTGPQAPAVSGAPDGGDSAAGVPDAGSSSAARDRRAGGSPSGSGSARPARRQPGVPAPPDRGTPRGRASGIDLILDEMGLSGQIGQHFIMPLETPGVSEATRKRIQLVSPAGYILYPWNVRDRGQLRELTAELRQLTRETTGQRPFIAVDQEGGRVQALRIDSLHEHPAASHMGAYDDPAYMEAVGYVTGVELASLGITMNFAPVLDLQGDLDRGGRGVIGDRALAPSPETVAELGLAYAEGLRRAGVIPVAKHFPGHGATAVDSHGSLPTVSASLDELREAHLLPFVEAAKAQIPAVMTAHIRYPAVEKELPVTLSRRWLQDILRGELGFTGVVVTDAMEMRAIADNYSLKEALYRGLQAGVNLFLLTAWIDPVEARNTVARLVAQGIVSEAQIREGARRVLELKAQFGLLTN